jgi:hypothetical protein
MFSADAFILDRTKIPRELHNAHFFFYSCNKVLVNYFPELSHQTILLSTDSEIRPEADWDKIAPFVARAYTLRRDKERQQTALSDGYFNKTLAPTEETASVE